MEAPSSFDGVRRFVPNIPAQALVGHAYHRADRLDEAVVALARAHGTALFDPFGNTRGWLDLGTALEATGNRDGACHAYQVVIDRWGHASPRSISAERARVRTAALACHSATHFSSRHPSVRHAGRERGGKLQVAGA